MGTIMTWSEIEAQYEGQWVLIAYEELDEDLNVVRGEVLAHSPDRDVVYQELLRLNGQKVAIEYVGEVPEDLAVVL